MDGGFINGLTHYMIEPENFKSFYYRFYRKQISLFLYDLSVGDYALLCGKCVFNRGNMYVSIKKQYSQQWVINFFIKKIINYYF